MTAALPRLFFLEHTQNRAVLQIRWFGQLIEVDSGKRKFRVEARQIEIYLII